MSQVVLTLVARSSTGLLRRRSSEASDEGAIPMGPNDGVATELCELGWHCSTAQRRLVQLAAEFADGDTWLIDGSPHAANWIAGALDVEVCTAREWIRIGRALRRLAKVDAAFAGRELSYSK